jgi:hypothetical protein
VDVVVEVGDWEHECCGKAIERDQIVDLSCISYEGSDGRPALAESHHGGLDVAAEVRVRGRVTEIQVVDQAGAPRPVLRVPSGKALRGFDDRDDGHLEDPWTGDLVASRSREFLVTVRVSGRDLKTG